MAGECTADSAVTQSRYIVYTVPILYKEKTSRSLVEAWVETIRNPKTRVRALEFRQVIGRR